jgi:hypothetical protein
METAELAALEALADPRIGPVAVEELAGELAAHFPSSAVDIGSLEPVEAAELDNARRALPIEWAAATVTYGEVLDDFAGYCREALDDVDVIDEQPARLLLAWRRERSAVELRAGFLFCERLASEESALLLGDLGPAAPARFVDDAALRAKLALYDLGRLEKINAVRSSVFVYFEWFLRDAYGVKLLPASAFTQGLIDRGVISLGMG